MKKGADRRDRDIWIGEILETWRKLGLTAAEDRAAAAELMGFDAEILRSRSGTGAQPLPGADRTGPSDATPAVATPRAPEAAAPRSQVIPSEISDETWLMATDAPSWVTSAVPLGTEQSAHLLWRPPHVPLLRPHWTRHILAAIAAVRVQEGALDERRVIEAAARARPIVRVPRRHKRTLRRGLHVLVDRGEAMLPFGRDAQQVVGQLRVVVGTAQVVAAAFERTPLFDDVLWLRQRRRGTWAPPAPGIPILILSDLGISQRYGDTRGGTVSEWRAFAALCRAAGCRAVALVPRGEKAWPPALRQAFTIIPWDQRTNLSTVLRLLFAPAVPS